MLLRFRLLKVSNRCERVVAACADEAYGRSCSVSTELSSGTSSSPVAGRWWCRSGRSRGSSIPVLSAGGAARANDLARTSPHLRNRTVWRFLLRYACALCSTSTLTATSSAGRSQSRTRLRGRSSRWLKLASELEAARKAVREDVGRRLRGRLRRKPFKSDLLTAQSLAAAGWIRRSVGSRRTS